MNNEVANFKALSTTILAEVTALNTAIQAVSNKVSLEMNAQLEIRDEVYQTAATSPVLTNGPSGTSSGGEN